MKNLRFINVLLVMLLLAVACKKKDDGDADPGCTVTTDYTSIAVINELAEFVTTDSDDWTNDSAWCSSITSLFNTDTLNLESTIADSIHVMAFPVPAQWVQQLAVYSVKKCMVQFAIVDESLHVRLKNSFLAPEGFSTRYYWNFVDSLGEFQNGHYYRMYYAAHAKDHLFFYKGHGDILVQQ